MSLPIELDLVIPVLDEAHVLASSVERLRTTMLAQRELSWRIVVVDNGSTDATARIGQELASRLPEVQFLHLETRGRGRALRTTWMETDARFSLYMDVDLSTDLTAVGCTIDLLRQGADVVTGSRLDRAARVTRSWKREVLSRGYNRLVRGMLGTRSFDDAQCGFKAIRVESVRPLLPLVENQHWFFDTELLVLAEYAGLVVRTLPVVWVEDADSRVNIPRTIWEDIQGLRRLRRTARGLVERWVARP
jgi:glycosyltransferase involved in cell wall biosynthesis